MILISPVRPALATARAMPSAMSSFAAKKPVTSLLAERMSVALVSAIWRSQSAATTGSVFSVPSTAEVKPSIRAPLVASPEMPPMSATVPDPPRASTMASPPILPASELSVPM